MRREDIDHIRHVCQHKLNVHPTDGPEGYEVLRLFFDMNDDDIDALGTLLNWVSNHGLERFLAQRERIMTLESLLYG